MSASEVEPVPPVSEPIIVCVGASAGGIEALKDLFVTMPADTGLVFVVIQHLDPTRTSHMPELMRRYTTMDVVEAADDTPIRPNTVYTIPPNHYLEPRNGRLALTPPIKHAGMRMPIDHFFRSLAEAARERAIGIILSGSGADGTLGVRAIRGVGGMVMVQDPTTAQFGDMPRAAIETGLVDFILPPEEMPKALVAYARQTHGSPDGEDEAKALDGEPPMMLNAILHQLISRADLDLRQYKRNTLLRRVRRRMGLRQIDQLGDYVRALREDPEEVRKLAKDMLIGVTSFFREPEAFETLRETVIAPLVAAKREGDPIRVWVAGCATGEEAYSIAMLIQEEQTAAHRNSPVQIFATDINDEALSEARAGSFPESIANDISSERLDRFFTRRGSAYQVNNQLRESIIFSVQNLLSDPPFSRLDLIICRNVLIYLVSEAQKKIISLFAFALNPGGYLFLGKSEGTADHDELFTSLSKPWRIYRRSPASYPLTAFPVMTSKSRLLAGSEPTQAVHRTMDLAALNQQVLLMHFGAAVVLVDEQANILHFFGPTSRYLGHPTGEASLNLLTMTPEPISVKLRGGLYRVVRENETVRLTHLLLPEGEEARFIDVTLTPVVERRTGLKLYAVIFEDAQETGQAEVIPADENAIHDSELLVRQLQSELRVAQDDLRVVIEQYETSNEELKAANEEMMSMNEELQSSNEELETSKEELQSVNEELVTVNAQLSDKIEELSEVNNDLANLFAATDIATIFVDRDLRIKRFTPAATKLLNLIPADAGRPIGDITQRFEGEGLAKDAARMMRDLTSMEREVHAGEGTWYTLRIIPYRTLDNRIEGLVITFANVTRLKRVDTALQDASVLFENIVDTVSQPVLVLDADLRIMLTNRAFRGLFQVSSEATQGQLLYHLGNGQWDIPALRTLLEQIVPRDTRVEGFAVEHTFPQLGRRTMELNARRITQQAGSPALILLAFTDVTERRDHEQAIRRLTAQLRAVDGDLETVGHALGHDLRAPLRTVSNAVKSLEAHEALQLDARGRERVARLRSATSELSELTEALLRLTRAARGELRPRGVDLSNLVRQVAEELRNRNPATKLEVEIQEGLTAHGDPQLLRLALEGLFDTAGRFTREQSEPRISFGAIEQDGSTTYYLRDNGTGLDLLQGEPLLDAFRRLPAGDGHESLSVTVAAAQRVIERHGGRLWAESHPGEGATFYLTLP